MRKATKISCSDRPRCNENNTYFFRDNLTILIEPHLDTIQISYQQLISNDRIYLSISHMPCSPIKWFYPLKILIFGTKMLISEMDVLLATIVTQIFLTSFKHKLEQALNIKKVFCTNKR